MAQVSPSSEAAKLLPPPPPVYSEVPIRSSSPRSPSLGERSPNEAGFRNNGSVKSPMTGSSISMISRVSSNGSQESSTEFTNGLRVHAPRWPFSDNGEPLTPTQPITPEIIATPPPENRSTLKPLPNPHASRKPLGDGTNNLNRLVHRRVSSDNPAAAPSLQINDRHGRAVSMSKMDEEDSPDSHQPLQYHHQALEDAHMKSLGKRASKMTIGTNGSEASNSSDFAHRSEYLGPSGMRNSYVGGNLQRPDSGFSSTSDVRGRTNSPQIRPLSHVRNASRHSRSPDTRPSSYIDLLNVPYPQSAPSGAENLVNAGLRTVIGNNASLLSTRKTLDMYRANVKKTSDPAIQYEFAVFMISAAQDEGLEAESASDLASHKASGSMRDDLLKEAKQILQKLCDRSYPFAQYYLADGYASGLFNGGKPDLERSFPLFHAASKHGHAEAMYRTALCYEWGWGCRVDAAKAVQFYQHAASKNHPGAMLRLGRACLTGDMGLGKRYREGVRWLKRGAESADFQYNQAPYDLACLHESGYGADVFKDESYAAQLYTKAADLGHKEACFRLGEAYEYGQLNCPKDPALSIHFYTGAAEQDHPQAQMALCAWYMVGVQHVLEKDESESYEWAKRAAQLGLAKAQYTLGYFTEMGIGCRRDPLEANVWYVRAADQGEERAKHRIAAIRAAATGADPVTAAMRKSNNIEKSVTPDGEKKKRFGIF